MPETIDQARTRAALAARVRGLALAIGAGALIVGAVGCGGSDRQSGTPQAAISLPTVTAPAPLAAPAETQAKKSAANAKQSKDTGASLRSDTKQSTGHNHGSQQQDAGEKSGVRGHHHSDHTTEARGPSVKPQHKSGRDPQD